jgi:general stress protein YciG
MDPDRRREIARKGGASVPGEKRSFTRDRDLAANAGRKGGSSSRGGGRPPGQI